MKLRKFNSYDEYETYYENKESEERYEIVDIVRTENRVCADMMTDTKSVKIALNRFFRTVKDCKDFADWEGDIRESIENGYWKDDSMKDAGYAWEVEDHDGSYYICIILTNAYLNA